MNSLPVNPQSPSRETPLLAAVIIPTFNHAATVCDISVRAHSLGLPVIVVDDGSTDDTLARLAPLHLANLHVVSHDRNRGKAAALATGFAKAASLNATHAVTIDADGQLDPEDIPALLAKARLDPDALILGTRPTQIEGCPQRCNVGRRNAGIAVLAQCGLQLSDTQCGLRIYPLALIRRVRCRASRYAFEAEIITRAAWAGFPVREHPVHCRYFPPAKRVSHFKPWADSWRQGGTHALLLLEAMLPWGKARPSLSGIADTPLWKQVLGWINPLRAWQEVRRDDLGDLRLAAGLGIGVIIGTLPFYGLHTAIALFTAWRLHQHPASVILGTQVSTPPLGVLLAATSITLGSLLTTGGLPNLHLDAFTPAEIWRVGGLAFLQWLIGSIPLGFLLGLAAYGLGALIGSRLRLPLHASASSEVSGHPEQGVQPDQPQPTGTHLGDHAGQGLNGRSHHSPAGMVAPIVE